MSKPEWCPQDVWGATKDPFDVLYENETDLEGGCEQGIREMCARAIMAAEKRGEEREREAIITLASEYVWDDHALAQATPIGLACHHQSLEIIAAISNRTAS